MTALEPLVLSGLRLAADQPLRRAVTRPAARLTEDYRARYDDRTVIYDLFAAADGHGAWAVCPRLLNLARPLRTALAVEGRAVALKRRVWKRAEGVFLPDLAAGQKLTLDLGGTRQSLAVRPSLAGAFAGRRALLAVNKDNPLSALRDWARWHAHHHGATAAVVFDNGSTAYGCDAAQAALQAGLGAGGLALVVAADFPYGPRDKGGRFDVSPRFFQSAMLNIARLDMLARAASVLSVDIDELVHPVPGGSIFEQAEQARLGVVSFHGQWVFSQQMPPQPHAAHRWYRPDGRRCNGKWCAVPGRGLARAPWLVHRFAEPLFGLTARRDLGFWHCRQMTTGWKSARSHSPGDLRPVPGLLEAMAQAALVPTTKDTP